MLDRDGLSNTRCHERRWSCLLGMQVEEECGYKVEVGDIRPVVSYQSSMGISGSRHSMFYVEVDESKRVSGGGGLE